MAFIPLIWCFVSALLGLDVPAALTKHAYLGGLDRITEFISYSSLGIRRVSLPPIVSVNQILQGKKTQPNLQLSNYEIT